MKSVVELKDQNMSSPSKSNSRNQAEWLDLFHEANNQEPEVYVFDDDASSQFDYIRRVEGKAISEIEAENEGGLWAVAFVNGSPKDEINYLAATRVMGALPAEYTKVVISHVHSSKPFLPEGFDDILEWLEHIGVFVIYYDPSFCGHSQNIRDVLAEVCDYKMMTTDFYNNATYIERIKTPDLIYLNRIRRFESLLGNTNLKRAHAHFAKAKIDNRMRFYSLKDKGKNGFDATETLEKLSFDELSWPGIPAGHDATPLSARVFFPALDEDYVRDYADLAEKADRWGRAWQQTFAKHGLCLPNGFTRNHEKQLTELGRILGVEEELVSPRGENVEGLEPGSSVRINVFHFDEIEEYLEETPENRPTFQNLIDDISSCAHETNFTVRLHALFGNGFAKEIASFPDDEERGYEYKYDRIKSAADLRLPIDEYAVAIYNAADCRVTEGDEIQTRAQMACMLEGPFDDVAFMISVAASPDSNQKELFETLSKYGTVVYDDLTGSEIDVYSGQYEDTERKLVLTKNARIDEKRRSYFDDLTLARTLEELFSRDPVLKKSQITSMASDALAVLRAVSDIVTLSNDQSDEIGEEAYLYTSAGNEVNDTLLSLTDGKGFERFPSWFEKVDGILERLDIWESMLQDMGCSMLVLDNYDAGIDKYEKLWEVGKLLGIDSSINALEHGVPAEDIIA